MLFLVVQGQNHTAIFVESDLVDVFTSVRSLRYLKLRDFEINELVADGISQIMERRPRGAKAQVILERCGFSGVANAKLLDAKVKADMFKDEFGPGRETLVFNNCENKTIELGYFTKKAPKKKMVPALFFCAVGFFIYNVIALYRRFFFSSSLMSIAEA